MSKDFLNTSFFVGNILETSNLLSRPVHKAVHYQSYFNLKFNGYISTSRLYTLSWLSLKSYRISLASLAHPDAIYSFMNNVTSLHSQLVCCSAVHSIASSLITVPALCTLLDSPKQCVCPFRLIEKASDKIRGISLLVFMKPYYYICLSTFKLRSYTNKITKSF